MEAFRSRPQSTTRSLPIKLLIAVALVVIGCDTMLSATAQTVLSDGSIMSDTPPPGAPVTACTVPPQPDASKLLVITGDAPVTYVFACGYNRPEGKCAVIPCSPAAKICLSPCAL